MEKIERIGNLLIEKGKWDIVLTIMDQEKNRFLEQSMNIREIAKLNKILGEMVQRGIKEKHCLLCEHDRKYHYTYCGEKLQIRRADCRGQKKKYFTLIKEL